MWSFESRSKIKPCCSGDFDVDQAAGDLLQRREALGEGLAHAGLMPLDRILAEIRDHRAEVNVIDHAQAADRTG